MKPQEFLRENEFIGDDAHQMHKSHQLHMLREECYHSAANAIKLHKLLGELPEGHDLDAWAAEKISLANDYLKTVTEWLEYDVMGGTNEAMMAGGMEAFSMESAERQYTELLGEEQGVAEGKVINTYLWHGSRQKIPMLEPRQSVDTGGAAGSNQNAIYATSDPKVAIAMGLTIAGSDTGMFPNDPQMVLFSGKIRKGEYVYLHKLPFKGPDGKPQFVQGGNSREFHSIPGVEGIKPIEIKEIPVNKYLNLIRKATPADLKLRKKYMKKQGVTESLQNPAQEQINQILRSQAPNGNYEDDRYLDWIIGPESIQQLVQQTKLPLNQVRNYVTAFCQNPNPEGVAEGEITRTATGTKHRSTAAYGGTEKDTDHLRTLDKATTNKIDKAIGVKFKKQGRGLDLGETTAAGSVSTVPAVGGGTLFGGNYSNSSSPFKKKSAKKESMIKR